MIEAHNLNPLNWEGGRVKILFVLLTGLLLTASADAQEFVGNPNRTVYVNGSVGRTILDDASKLLHLVKKSKEDITLIINSPGGSVATGMQFVGAMEIAQAEGVHIKCLVPYAAASMAFIIYSKCDSRYALPRAMFLWHGISLRLSGRFQIPTLEFIVEELKLFRQDFLELQMQATGIEVGQFMYYYTNEAWVPAFRLSQISKDFFTVVKKVRGVKLRRLYKSFYGGRWLTNGPANSGKFVNQRELLELIELRK